jgi:hypothetical protein
MYCFAALAMTVERAAHSDLSPQPEEAAQRAVSKAEATGGASSFETREDALLRMRD